MNNKTNIEEDIKRCKELNAGVIYFMSKPQDCELYAQAIENILADREKYKTLYEKYANGELFSAKQLKFIEEEREKHFIHKKEVEQIQAKANKYDSLVEKIEEKLEKLNKEEQELQDNISDEERQEYSDASIAYALSYIEKQREILQELLNTEKE